MPPFDGVSHKRSLEYIKVEIIIKYKSSGDNLVLTCAVATINADLLQHFVKK